MKKNSLLFVSIIILAVVYLSYTKRNLIYIEGGRCNETDKAALKALAEFVKKPKWFKREFYQVNSKPKECNMMMVNYNCNRQILSLTDDIWSGISAQYFISETELQIISQKNKSFNEIAKNYKKTDVFLNIPFYMPGILSVRN
jgi:hypothetical protein